MVADGAGRQAFRLWVGRRDAEIAGRGHDASRPQRCREADGPEQQPYGVHPAHERSPHR